MHLNKILCIRSKHTILEFIYTRCCCCSIYYVFRNISNKVNPECIFNKENVENCYTMNVFNEKYISAQKDSYEAIKMFPLNRIFLVS